MNWPDLMMREDFTPSAAYCQAKLANVLFTREFDRRNASHGITAQAMHPGKVGSNFASHGEASLRAYMAGQELIEPEEASRTIVWLATAAEPAMNGGRFFFDCMEADAGSIAQDEAAAKRLWLASERILHRVLATDTRLPAVT